MEFEEWMAMYDLEPWGDDWKQAAMVAAMVRNSAMGSTGEPVQSQDLIPTLENRKATDEIEDESLTARWRQKLNF